MVKAIVFPSGENSKSLMPPRSFVSLSASPPFALMIQIAFRPLSRSEMKAILEPSGDQRG